MDEKMIYDLLHEIIYVCITVILPIVTVYAVKMMQAKLTELRYCNMSDAHREWIERATDIVADIVLQVQQTFVDSLKHRGEFNAETAKEAKDKAVKMANELIAAELKEAIENIYGSFEEWLDVQIEKNVYQNK